MPELNDKQQRFADEYLIDLNATQAAIRAGYSPKTAGQQAHDLLKKLEIISYLGEQQAKLSERIGISQEMVVAELAKIGFSNIGHYLSFNHSGIEMVDSKMLTDDALRCVSEVSQTVTAEGGTVKFKLHDKISALDKLMRHLGGYNDKSPFDAPLSVRIVDDA